VPLSDTDVETVTRKVLLQKRPAAIPAVRDELNKYSGEVSRQLQGTRIGEVGSDAKVIVEVTRCYRCVGAPGNIVSGRSTRRHQQPARSQPASSTTPSPSSPADRRRLIPVTNHHAPPRDGHACPSRAQREDYRVVARLEVRRASSRGASADSSLISKLPRAGDTGVRTTQEHLADLLWTTCAEITGSSGTTWSRRSIAS
jgi:hypothetical protein